MDKYLEKMLNVVFKGKSDAELKEILGKLGKAASTEDVIAINNEYHLNISDENCKMIFDSLSSKEGAISNDSLETVAGGCNTSGC